MGWMLRPIDPAAEAAIRADPTPPPLGAADALGDDLRIRMIAKYTADRDDPATLPSVRRFLDQYLALLRAPRVYAVEDARGVVRPDHGGIRPRVLSPVEPRTRADLGRPRPRDHPVRPRAARRRCRGPAVGRRVRRAAGRSHDPRSAFRQWAEEAPRAVRDRLIELASMFVETAKKGWALVFEDRPEFSGLLANHTWPRAAVPAPSSVAESDAASFRCTFCAGIRAVGCGIGFPGGF